MIVLYFSFYYHQVNILYK